MDGENLARMANRIGDFFEAMPDRDQAMQDIATHIRKFWAPRMREQFLRELDLGLLDLSDMVREAVARHRRLLA